MLKRGLLASPTHIHAVWKCFASSCLPLRSQHTMHIIWFSEWTFVWGNTVSFGSWRAELTGPTPQQNRLEIKKQTKTMPSKKNAGEKPESSFSVLLKKLIYLATVLSNQIFVLLLKLRASLPLLVIKVKFLPYLKKLHDHVQEGTGGRHRGSGFWGWS